MYRICFLIANNGINKKRPNLSFSVSSRYQVRDNAKLNVVVMIQTCMQCVQFSSVQFEYGLH
jgi:hypothetical protein